MLLTTQKKRALAQKKTQTPSVSGLCKAQLTGLGRGPGEGQDVGLTTNIEIKKHNF